MSPEQAVTPAPGDTLGAYEIVGALGAGGMGVVFRARDRRLGRDVAVKVLAERLAHTPEARARFEREVRAIAALSHPNILAIHDFGIERGSLYAVMELLEGETLRDRIDRAPLSWRKAREIGASIADALAAAHAQNIVHRDLKPENVFLTSHGQVKVLDFGLAQRELKPLPDRDTSADLSTDPGTVMGTVPYMSPEQLRGDHVDGRSDIFSLGAVLYEMTTGERAFLRPTAPETMAAILREDPKRVAGTGRQVPAEAERLVLRCLEKNPEERFQTARDLAFALRAESGGALSTTTLRRLAGSGALARLAPWALTAAAIGAAFLAGRLLGRPSPAEPPRLRTLTYSGHDSSPSVSPDGRLVAFSSDRDGRRRIWLRQLSGAAEVPLTAGPDDFPRFSPDGASVLYSGSADGRTALHRIPTLGGSSRRIVEDVQDGDWSPDGKQVAFTRWTRNGAAIDTTVGLVPADGGGVRVLATLRGQTLVHPRFSPDGRTIALVDSGQSPRLSIFLVASQDGVVREVVPAKSGGHVSSVLWSADGSALLYAQTESVAVGFSGSPARVVRQDLRSQAARTLLWIPSHSDVITALGSDRLVFEFRSLRQNLQELPLGAGASPRWLTHGNSTDRQPVYSPAGDWVAFTSNRDGNLDLWKVSTSTGSVVRITEHAAEDWDPAFTADGRQVLWSSNRTGRFEVWMAEADGSNPRQVSHDGASAQNPTATPDGSWIVYTSARPDRPGVYKVRPDGSQTTLVAPQAALWPEVSPDGRLVLFTIVEADRHAIRVVRLEGGAPIPFEIRLQPGSDGGRARWLHDGRGIAFTDVDEAGVTGVFAQDFVPGRDTSATRRKLAGFDRGYVTESFGLGPDGSRITVAGSEQLWSLMVAEGVER